MNNQQLLQRISNVGLVLFLLAGCSVPVVTPTQIPPTPTEEMYEELDPNELAIVFEGSLKRLEVDSDGNVVQVDGIVTKMVVGDQQIALSSDKILLEGREAFIATKDYGKIKVKFNSSGGATLWLKPSQKERLKELAQ
jgi:hypothetical protein